MAIYLGENKVSLAGTNGGFMLNGRLITTKSYEFNLSDTNFSSLTPSTTQQSLTLPATDYSSAGTSITAFKIGESYDGTSINFKDHDYVVICSLVITFNYGTNNMNSLVRGVRFGYSKDSQKGKYPSTLNTSTGLYDVSKISTGSSYIGSSSTLIYQDTSNQYKAQSSGYGIYGTSDCGTSLDTSTGVGYCELKFSGFYLKSNDTYFPNSSIALLNAANTKIKGIWYIYEGDKNAYTEYQTMSRLLASGQITQ